MKWWIYREPWHIKPGGTVRGQVETEKCSKRLFSSSKGHTLFTVLAHPYFCLRHMNLWWRLFFFTVRFWRNLACWVWHPGCKHCSNISKQIVVPYCIRELLNNWSPANSTLLSQCLHFTLKLLEHVDLPSWHQDVWYVRMFYLNKQEQPAKSVF